MISFLKGTIIEKKPTEVVIETNSVGFSVLISVKTSENIPEEGNECFLYTTLIPKEDSLSLFGFYSKQERELFKMLINIPGIGPKSALGILSSIFPDDLINMIASGNTNLLQKIPGIGKKTAERIILELKDKVTSFAIDNVLSIEKTKFNTRQEALDAMIMLGYNKNTAEKIIKEVVSSSQKDLSTEEIIKYSLQKIMK
jgi:Holliday junction DNA helicase RuvA